MRDQRITIRVTEDIKDKVKEYAEKRGMTLTQYIIYCINKDIDEQKALNK